MNNLKEVSRSKEGRALLEHAKWVAERYERMNEQLLTLSSSFLGFLGVEIGLLAQIDAIYFRDSNLIKTVGVVAMSTLGLAIISFFCVLVSSTFEIPSLSNFQEVVDLEKEDIERYPFELMFSSDKVVPNIQQSYELENIALNRFYVPGLRLGSVAQIAVVILVILIWLN